jgi:mutator family transposase
VLALRVCAEEDKDGWACLLQDLRSRGAIQIDLIVTDGHEGLLAAVSELFAATPRQRCLVHKQRNVLPRHPATRAWRRTDRTCWHLESTEQTGGADPIGRLQSQVRAALSRSATQPGGGRRAPVDLLRVPRHDAPTHSDHQCH